jgi:O-succinylhomoserine sulfhydrylase
MSNKAFETIAIRNQMERTIQREHSVPLFLTSSFTFDSAEHGAALFQNEVEGNLYSRFSNPNTDEFVHKMCLLEGCEAGVATASGMAAVYTSLAALLHIGDHVVSSSAIFGNSLYILKNILPGMGIESTLVDVHDNEAYEKAIRPETKMVFVETPSNPTLDLADLQFLGELCKSKGILLVVDNCFATPYLQKPKDFGAGLVLHSATKYIDGQGRVMGGVIVGDEEPVQRCYEFIRRTGACLAPFNAWILSKSLETLALRMDRHCDNAEKLAHYLAQHSDVHQVIYPNHSSHPRYALSKQMNRGGGLVACVIKGGTERGARLLNSLQLHSLTANLGDSRSIATHPASTTHSKMSREEQEAVNISPGLIRFSVGLEHADDIIEDIDQALNKSKS